MCKYGCYHCGELDGEVEIDDDTGAYVCGNCGHHSVITLPVAVDILRDQEIRGTLDFSQDDISELLEESDLGELIRALMEESDEWEES